MIEKKIGTPERPLSDLGRIVYIKYWCQWIIDYFRELTNEQLNHLTIKKISQATAIKE